MNNKLHFPYASKSYDDQQQDKQNMQSLNNKSIKGNAKK